MTVPTTWTNCGQLCGETSDTPATAGSYAAAKTTAGGDSCRQMYGSRSVVPDEPDPRLQLSPAGLPLLEKDAP